MAYNLKNVFENKTALVSNTCSLNSYYIEDYDNIVMYCKRNKTFISYNKLTNSFDKVNDLDSDLYETIPINYSIRNRKIRNKLINENKKYIVNKLASYNFIS